MRQGSVRPVVDHQDSMVQPPTFCPPSSHTRSMASTLQILWAKRDKPGKICSRGSSLLWFGSPSVNSIEYLRAGSRTSSLLRSDKAVGPEENIIGTARKKAVARTCLSWNSPISLAGSMEIGHDQWMLVHQHCFFQPDFLLFSDAR